MVFYCHFRTMWNGIPLVALFGYCLLIVSFSLPISDQREAALFLQKYGYLEKRVAALFRPKSISSALKDFQRFVGIKETGVLDKETLEMMNTPRCGVQDKFSEHSFRRRKRYAAEGSKWKQTELTYRISKYPRRLKDRSKVDEEIHRAFKVWSDVTNLTIEERKRGRVNIDIRFERGEHGDGRAFDGPGDTLAHAFFPQYGGYAHFDDDEQWTLDDNPGTNLVQIAAHEFGHSLGLDHSDEQESIMAPYFQEADATLKLYLDDIRGIQLLYGTKSPSPPLEEKYPSGPRPDIRNAPDVCIDAKIDTITRTQNGSTYVFKGKFYWKILRDGVADGYPRIIKDDWDGLEDNLDASFMWLSGKTYFFKDGKYWRFTNRKMDVGYPKSLSRGFEGIPEKVDAAFVWSGNGKTYFLKGDKYWRFDSNSDPPVSEKYPKPISTWKGLPNNIDAAFQWENSRTYFFKGDMYYRFSDLAVQVDKSDPPFPRPTSEEWFKCSSFSH